MDEIKVNDGNGIYDNIGLIETLIIDCNDLPKQLMVGNYIGFCVKVVDMVQKLSKLKNGVKSDIESRDKQIETLSRLLNDKEENISDDEA